MSNTAAMERLDTFCKLAAAELIKPYRAPGGGPRGGVTRQTYTAPTPALAETKQTAVLTPPPPV